MTHTPTTPNVHRDADTALGMQVIRWLLLLAIVGGTTFALLTSYRPAGPDDYREALASGDVTSVSIGVPDRLALGLQLNVGSQSDGADLVAWTTGPLPWQRFAADDMRFSAASAWRRRQVCRSRPPTPPGSCS